jgi:hypothetical protein
LNCCCCPISVTLQKGTKELDGSSGFFKAVYPFKAILNMVFQPVAKPIGDPTKATSECGFEWWEYRVDGKLPYGDGASDSWRNGLSFPEVTHFDMFDPWYETQRPQDCVDKKGKPSPKPFSVAIPDRPGIEKGQGRDKLDAYIGIKLLANPNCKCKNPSAKLQLRVTAGKLYATLDQIGTFPSPPGNPPGW